MTQLLRVADVVARTRLSERRIRRAIADGNLAVVRPQGVRAVLVPEAALATFLRSNSAGQGAKEIG